MPDWLHDSFQHAADIPPLVLIARLGAAFAFGCAIAVIYWVSHRPGRRVDPSFVVTLVLLCILIAVVVQVIGNSVARAFSLAGALAIVRFRTLVEDTRDTAFVIFSVITGMALGAGYFTVALTGFGAVGVAAVAVRPWRGAAAAAPGEYTLCVRVGISESAQALLEAGLSRHLANYHLVEAATSRQGAVLDLTYEVRLRGDVPPVAFVGELNQLQGVQNVELRRR